MEELKKILTSLLISSPLQLTLSILDRDYAEQIGERIPYRRLGFPSLEYCLRAMPDILEVVGHGPHAEIIVHVTQKSAHINALVSKQKVNPPKRRTRYGVPKHCRPLRSKSSIVASTYVQMPFKPPIPPLLSLRPKNTIDSIPSYTKSINTSQISRASSSFSSNCNLPNSTISSTPTNSNGALSIPPLFNPRQKISFNWISSKTKSINTSQISPASSSFVSSANLPNSIISSTPANSTSIPPLFKPQQKNAINLIPNETKSINTSQMSPTPSSSLPSAKLPNSDISNTPTNSNGAISKYVSSSHRLSSYFSDSSDEDEDIINSCRQSSYQSINNDIPVKTQVSTTHLTSNATIPKGQLHFSHQSRNYLSDSSNDDENPPLPKTVISNRHCDSPILNSNVPAAVQNNLKRLMAKYDGGIWCRTLPQYYKEMFSKELDYAEYGYRALIFLCFDLPDIFICIQPDKGDHKLFYKPKGLPTDYDKDFKTPSSSIWDHDDDRPSTEQPVVDLESFMDKKWVYPDDVLHIYEEIPRQLIPSHLQNDFVDVVVAEVYDPSKFWLIFNEFYDALNQLMDDMQMFYASGGDYIPQHMLAVGMYCAALYNSEYHRALIVNKMVNVAGKVKVYYIDYGTVASVDSKFLKFLHKNFSRLPQQAIRARLCGIYPPTEKTQWSLESSNRFLELVHMKLLVAHIFSIDFERQILNVFLADTSEETDVYLNDTLQKEGYAIFTNQEQQKIKLSPRSTPWVRYIHLFPTFEEIECSAVPSYSEMYRLIKTGMPLEFIYSRYFGQRKPTDKVQDDDIIDLSSLEDDKNDSDNMERNPVSQEKMQPEALESKQPALLNERNFIDEGVYSENDDFMDSVVIESSLSKNRKDFKVCESLDSINEEVPTKHTKKEAYSKNIDDSTIIEPNTTEKECLDILHNETNNNRKESGQNCEEKKKTEPEDITEYAEKIQATLAIRPPPGFEKLLPKPAFSTTTHIGLDNMKNLYVSQTTNVCPATSNVNQHLNLTLSQVPYPLDQRNCHQPQPIVHQSQPYVVQQAQSYMQALQQASLNGAFQNYMSYQHFPPQTFTLGQVNNSQMCGSSTIPTPPINYSNQTAPAYIHPERTKIQLSIFQKLRENQKLQLEFVKFLQNQEYSLSLISKRNMFDYVLYNLLNNPLSMYDELHNNIIYCLLNSLSDIEICKLVGVLEANYLSTVMSQLNMNSFTNLENVKNVLPHLKKKRRCVIEAELNGYIFHVVWYHQEPHVYVKELLDFLKISTPIAEVRKLIAYADEELTITAVSLHSNVEIYDELSRYIKMDKNVVLHIIPTTSIPQLAVTLKSNFEQSHFETFLEKVKPDSDLWFSV